MRERGNLYDRSASPLRRPRWTAGPLEAPLGALGIGLTNGSLDTLQIQYNGVCQRSPVPAPLHSAFSLAPHPDPDPDLQSGPCLQTRVQGDGSLFQCTDLVLISNYTVPSNWTCTVDATVSGNATI